MKAHFTVEGNPLKQPIRPLSPELRLELQTQLRDLLNRKIIRPSKSPWGCAPVFVKKKTGEWRMCVDYRPLNLRMKGDAYPIPLLWDCIQAVAGYRFYTCLDLSWGFWNIPLEESTKELTAIVCPEGAYEFNVLPFGIKNSPSECQRAVDLAFQGLIMRGVIVYIDDIVIYTNTIDEHLDLFREVFQRCTTLGLSLKITKSTMMKDSVALLGHQVGTKGIQPHHKKVEAVQKARAPRNKQELQSFLGLAGYIRRFVPYYADTTAPLLTLLKKNEPWVWTDQHEAAFQALKVAIGNHVLLSAPDRNGKPYILATDASDVGIGAVLLQQADGDPAILEVASKTLTAAERKWSTHEREAFAIKWGVDHFRDHLRGARFYILTDHSSLQWLGKAQSGKVLRWSLFLQEYDFTILHVKGEENFIADWLSRSTDDVDEDALIDSISTPIYFLEDGARKYIPSRESLRGYPSERIKPEERKFLTLGEGETWYHFRSGIPYIPQEYRDNLLYWFHAGPLGGHGGVNRTYRRMKKCVWWLSMHKDILEYISKCVLCQRQNAKLPSKGFEGILSKPRPFQLISLDYLFFSKEDGFSQPINCLVIIDHCTRFMQACYTPDTTAKTTIRYLKDRWLSIFGVPGAVLTDRGPAFRAAEFQKYITDTLGCFMTFSSAYYPQGNGLNESSHRILRSTVNAMVRRSIGVHFMDVELFQDSLPTCLMVYNSTPHIAIGTSPFMKMVGMELILPGWQNLTQEHEPMAKTIREVETIKEVREITYSEGDYTKPGRQLIIGDYLIFARNPHEQRKDINTIPSGEYKKGQFSPPQRVVAVGDKTVQVVPVGAPGRSPAARGAGCAMSPTQGGHAAIARVVQPWRGGVACSLSPMATAHRPREGLHVECS